MGQKKHKIIFASLFALIQLCLISGCTYPFASFKNGKALPKTLGDNWKPPRRAIKKAGKIHAPITIDPAIFEGEISLAESIAFALQNNPDTSISYAQIQQSIAELGLARSELYPTFSTSGLLSRTRFGTTFPPDILIFQWLTTYGGQFDINYTLWDFGKRLAQSESALQSLFAMGWSYNQQIQTMVRTITNAYYDNLYQKATLANDQQNVMDALLILEAAQKKLNTGVGDVTQLVQAKTNYLQRQVDLVDQKDRAQASLIQLAADMGMPGNVEFTTQNFPCELPTQNFIEGMDELIENALESRPDLIKRKAEVSAKKAKVVESRLDYLPKINGLAHADYFDYNNFYKGHWNYRWQISVDFPFFEGFKYRNQIRSAKAELKQAEAALKKEQDNVMKEVSIYTTNFKNSVDRVEFSTAFLDSALEEFDVTLSNYKAGTGDIINVMQAQTSLSEARTKYTDAIKDLFVSLTNLAYSTGSLIAPALDSSWDSIYEFQESYND